MQRVYKSGYKCYSHFCMDYRLTPFLVSEGTLAAFVAVLFKDGLSAGTIKSYLSAVRHT